jgi:hypothetical protein
MNAMQARSLINSYPNEFAQGYDEAKDYRGMISATGVTFDDDPSSDRSMAYDLGRSLRIGMDVA